MRTVVTVRPDTYTIQNKKNRVIVDLYEHPAQLLDLYEHLAQLQQRERARGVAETHGDTFTLAPDYVPPPHAGHTHLHLHAASGAPKLGWLGRTLSALPALCFVHCLASSVLMLVLPAAASLWSQGEWLEAPLGIVSMAALAAMLTRRGLWRSLAGALFVLALGVGLLGLSQEVESAHRVSLLLLVGTQVVLWQKKRQQAAATGGSCAVHRAAH